MSLCVLDASATFPWLFEDEASPEAEFDSAGVAKAIGLLRRLPLEVDDAALSHAFDAVLDLARVHRLTAYDAHCLDLALRRGLPLATGDSSLRAAASAAGAAVLGGER